MVERGLEDGGMGGEKVWLYTENAYDISEPNKITRLST